MRSRKSWAILAGAVCLGAAEVCSAANINIDFGGAAGNGTQTQMGSAEVAGVIPSSNWNSFAVNAQATPVGLNDSTGAASGATATWNSNNLWTTGAADTAGNLRMMRGYLDVDDFSSATTPGRTATVTVAGLPAAVASSPYTVIVYYDGDNGASDRTGKFSITGATTGNGTLYGRDGANQTFGGTYVLGSTPIDPLNGLADNTNTDNNSVAALAIPAGNFLFFGGLTGNTFTLSATSYVSSDGTNRAAIQGIQIVPGAIPEPSSIGFVGLCLGAAAARRRRRA